MIISSLSSDLKNVQNWCTSNHMCINFSKSKILYISSKSIRCQIVNYPSIEFQGSYVNPSTEEKLLGVTIDSTLSWDTHVHNVLKKCNTYLYLLSRIKTFLSLQNRKLFYNAYVLPHFDYCCIVWGSCSSTLEGKVIKLQKRAARLILDCDFSMPSTLMFTKLDWLAFPDRVIYLKALQMYKTINGNAPDYLKALFTFSSEIHTRDLRSSSQSLLYIPKPKSELYRKTFSYSGS